MVQPCTLPEYTKVKYNKVGWLYYNAIIELVEEYPVEQITVQMILDKTETSRSTFYKYFSDKFALMHYVHYYDVIRSNMQVAPEVLPVFYRQKIEFYKGLFAYEGQNSFREFHRHFWVNNFRNNYIEQYGAASYTPIINNCFLFYVDGLYSMMKEWILSDCASLSDDEILSVSRYFYPAPLTEKNIVDLKELIKV